MGKLDSILEGLKQSIRGKDFRDTKKEILQEEPKVTNTTSRSGSDDSFDANKNDVSDDRRTVLKPDPYQVEVDKINEQIKQAKALTPEDMRRMIQAQARHEVKHDIYRNTMAGQASEHAEKIARADHKAEISQKADENKPIVGEKVQASFKDRFLAKKEKRRGR